MDVFTHKPSNKIGITRSIPSNPNNENDLAFTKRLVTEFGVATIPISPFYANGADTKCIRFCFAKQQHTLEQAAARLQALSPIAS